ncbi:carbonic anhydrase family protein [Pelomonas sp. V22]|uniref:carbonic anhydrase n=1 Tax=Pelomonas sp. V22 TaxID=2822139 RepID=UPI0024A8178F|nr:carbonic anhydrase family protein [Pelomonas sp. V22]MDI4635275.1 carbonic anhydrase family protein [Pelomonas sp. V22]
MSKSKRTLGFALSLGLALAPAFSAGPKTKPVEKADKAETEKPAAAATPASEEPLDVLRERLAERLKTTPKGESAKVTGRGGPDAKSDPKAKAKAEVHWGYAGDIGPEHWAELKPEFRACAIGTRQSPIDIREGIKVDLAPIAFDYKPSSFAVLDNGHTVQVNMAAGNSLEVMGKRYALQQFHFHRPAEERINGRGFEMVAHLVHKDAEGRLAVLAVLFEQGPDDTKQPVVQSVWANIPLEKHEALAGQGPLDLTQLLPADRGYYTYMGSLTTPPCSEGVLWLVMRQPVALSAAQLNVFARLYPMNARPVQAGSGRLIKESQ